MCHGLSERVLNNLSSGGVRQEEDDGIMIRRGLKGRG